MDGYGLPKTDVGSAIAAAKKPTLDRLFAHYPNIRLRAHGTAVGMPSDDDMGNSEVGHNAIGAGQVYSQGASLVSNAIASGAIWQGEAWQQIVAGAKTGRGVVHFIGLFSDGNVHSHIDHLKAMVVQAKAEGRQDRAHPRPARRPRRAGNQRAGICGALRGLPGEISTDGFDARIASGGGRQYITMDRYDANWAMVEKGWKTHVLGQARSSPMPPRRSTACASESRHHRPGSAGVRHRRPRPADRHHRGRRFGCLLQLPRRPGHRDHPRFRRGDFDKFDRVRFRR
jgi:2,3-bisphosphoglycerate-independent phosphoglycerate mutase